MRGRKSERATRKGRREDGEDEMRDRDVRQNEGERNVRKKRLGEIEREKQTHEIGEKDRGSEIDGNLREEKRKNCEKKFLDKEAKGR